METNLGVESLPVRISEEDRLARYTIPTTGQNPPAVESRRQATEDVDANRKAEEWARMVMRPTVQGSLTLEYYNKGFGDLDTCALVAALGEQVQAANDGDLDRAEGMLITQAHTLDAMFNDLARRAIKSARLKNLDTYMKLALRAQSQCRATLEALGELKNPRATAFVNQANIAHGPQQVNNVPAPDSRTPRARKTKDQKSELLEADDGQWLDPGTTGTAGGIDPDVAALGKVDRSEDG